MKYDKNNVFAKIIRAELKCDKIYEDETVIAFHDLHPAAPVHVLVLPKGEYKSFHDFVAQDDAGLVAHFFKTVREIARDLGLAESGYRIIMNHGADAAQTVDHFHVHILGKRPLGPLVTGDVHHA